MADDINNYSLNVMFKLQTSQALVGLDDILTSVNSIQEAVRKVSTIMSGEMVKSVTAIQQQFGKIAVSTTDIGKTTTKTSIDLSKASETITKTFEDYEKITLELQKQFKFQEDMDKLYKKRNEFDLEATKEGKKHTGIGEQVAAAWHKVGGGVKSAITDFASMLVGVEAVKGAFAAFIEEENKFNAANYRVYGSQEAIVQQVNATTAAYGLMRKQAMEAYVSLGSSIRTGKDELAKMVDVNVKFSTVLGVSQKDLGNWQRSMSGIGMSLTQTTALLTRQAETMRTLGMTAQQMGNMLNVQANTALQRQALWGTEVAAINELEGNLTGFANAANVPMAAVGELGSELNKIFSSKEGFFFFTSQSQLTEEWAASTTEAQKNVARAYSGMDAVLKERMRAEKESGASGGVLLAIQEGNAAAMRMSLPAYQALVTAQKAAGDSVNIFSADQAKVAKTIRDATYNALKTDNLFAESTRTIAMNWEKTMSKLDSAWSNMMVAIKPGVMWFINYVISPLIDSISWVLNLLSGTSGPAATAADSLDKVTAAAKPPVTWFQYITDAVKGFCGDLDGLVLGIGALAGVWWVLKMGIGLWQSFMVATNSVKLLAIALAAVAVGAGFWMLAEAFKEMAKLGWGIIGPLIAVAVTLGILTVALVVMGTLGWLGVAASLALAVAFVALGFAALEVSWAFQNVVAGIKELIEVGAGPLVEVGLALIVFGGALLAGAALIGLGSAALALVGIPFAAGMGFLSVGLWLLSDDAVEKMRTLGSDNSMQKFGEALQSIAPGIGAFLSEMGTGTKFWYAMGNLSSGLNKIDPAQMLSVGEAMKSLAIGFAGAMGAMAQSPAGDITAAFNDLLMVIPVINSVTDKIAAALETGQEKIRVQITELKTSFATLGAMVMLGPLVGLIASADTGRKKVLAETISTVQVKSDTGGGVAARWEQADIQAKQLDLMSTIAESVEKVSTNPAAGIQQIVALLSEHLPKLGESPSKLGSRMNNWA